MDPAVLAVLTIVDLVLCLFGLASNTLVCVIIIRHRRSVSFSNSFYMKIVILTIFNNIQLMAWLICMLPAALINPESNYGLQCLFWVFGFLVHTLQWSVLWMTLAIVINLCRAIKCLAMFRKQHFSRLHIAGQIVVCVCASLGLASLTYARGCRFFYKFLLGWMYECAEDTSSSVLLTNVVVSGAICVTVIASYALMAISNCHSKRTVVMAFERKPHDQLHQSESADQQKQAGQQHQVQRHGLKEEVKLMTDYALFCFVAILYQLLFWITVLLFQSNETFMTLSTVLSNFSCYCTSYVLMYFDSRVRSRLPFQCCKRNDARVNAA